MSKTLSPRNSDLAPAPPGCSAPDLTASQPTDEPGASRLALTPQFIRRCLRVAGVTACLFAVTEFALNQPDVQQRLPLPSHGINLPMLDVNLALNERYVADEGGVDCIFVGDSTVHRGIDPEQFRQDLWQNRQLSTRTFHLTTGGASPATKRLLTDLAVWHAPQVIVYCVSSEIFDVNSNQTQAGTVASNPWVRHRLGQINLAGWLWGNIRTIQYCLLLRNVSQGREFVDTLRARSNRCQFVTRCGFVPSYYRLPVNPKGKAKNQTSVKSGSFPGLARILRHSPEVQVVFLLMPIHVMAFDELEVDRVQWMAQRDRLAQEVRAAGAIWWELPTDELSDDHWQDTRHLNVDGAAIYTKQLADRFATGISDGTIRITTVRETQQ